jgi:hypothetical protein
MTLLCEYHVARFSALSACERSLHMPSDYVLTIGATSVYFATMVTLMMVLDVPFPIITDNHTTAFCLSHVRILRTSYSCDVSQ